MSNYPNCICPAGQVYDLPSNTCVVDTGISCPSNAAGTYPACVCPDGLQYHYSANICVADPTAPVCPPDATGAYPACVCGSGSIYIPETNSCGYTGVAVTDIIYTSPVYPMNGNGYGSHIHTLGLPDLGKYAVACLSGPNMDGVVATPFVSAPNVEDVGIIEVVSEAPHIDRLDRYRDVDGNGSKELDDTESIAAAMDA